MMRSARPVLTILTLCALGSVSAQNTFYTRYNPSYADAGHITPGPDGSFYGVTRDATGEFINYYRVAEDGDLTWMREMDFASFVVPTRITALTDSSFAFLVVDFGSSATKLVKVAHDGELVWCRSYDIGSAASFQSLAATTDGGIMLTGSGCLGADMILHLDADGHILSQHGHASFDSDFQRPNAMDMVHDGDNTYSYFGWAFQSGNNYTPLTFFRSDSAGNVYSYREIHFPLGGAHYFSTGKLIARSTSGGHFLAQEVDGPEPADHVVLFYLNAQDELVWFKDIATPDERMGVSAICATEDGGCVLVGNNVLTIDPYLYTTYAVKFNEQGELLWSKSVGDITEPMWDRVGMQELVPATNGAFMSVPVRYSSFDVCRTDPEFNGYCHNTPFSPVITDPVPTVLPYPLTNTTINFIEGNVDVVPEPSSHTRTDLCYTTGIPETAIAPDLNIAPNPASAAFQVFIASDKPERVVVNLLNALGAVCSTYQFQAQPDGPVVIPAEHLPDGTYVVDVRIADRSQRALVSVQH